MGVGARIKNKTNSLVNTVSLMILFLLVGCIPEQVSIESTKLPNDAETVEETSTPNNPEDQLIISDGTWSLATAIIEEDGCNAGQYQDLEAMVSDQMEISNGTVSSFTVEDSNCILTGTNFICAPQDVSESALANTAMLYINSVMSGTILSENELVLDFEVVMESCEGFGCNAIEMALTFSCTIELSKSAVY